MMFDADIARMVSVAKALPTSTVSCLIENLIEVLDQRSGDPDLEDCNDFEEDRTA